MTNDLRHALHDLAEGLGVHDLRQPFERVSLHLPKLAGLFKNSLLHLNLLRETISQE